MATPPTFVGTYVPTGAFTTNDQTSFTTPPFDVTSGDLIVVLESGEHGNNLSTNPAAPTDTGGASITWTRRVLSAAAADRTHTIVWTGAVGATATGITVSVARPYTAALTSSVYWGFMISLYRNHGGVGVVYSGNNTTGSAAPSLAATCAANSAVVMVCADWNATVGTSRVYRTINGSAMSELNYVYVNGFVTQYMAHRLDTGAAGSITVGLTAPSTQRWTIGGVEVLGTGTTAPAQNGWGVAA